MTRGDTAQILAEHDPGYLRRRKRERRWVVVVVVLAVIALCGAAYAVRSAFRTETRVTEIRQLVESPCLEYGSHSRQCEEAFEAAVASINHREACYVGAEMGIHPASCDGAHLRLPEPSASSSPPTAETTPASHAPATPIGGDVTSSPSTGHSLPGRHEGGSRGTDQPSHPNGPSVPHQSGGEAPAATPPAPTTPSSPQSSSSQTTERNESTVVEAPPAEAPKEPVRSVVGGLTESVGATVEGLGETVGGTVEGVESTTCQLAKLLCHE